MAIIIEFCFSANRIRVSQLYGLNLVLYHEDGVVPLVVTGNSATIPKLFYRYLSTGLHVNNWFEGGSPFDHNSSCYNSIVAVRGMHEQVMNKMNAESRIAKPKPEHVWISQHSMANAQFSFMGLMACFPDELGYYAFSEADMAAMFHFWRVIGHCLGMEDRFNLCDSDNVPEIQAMCRYIYDKFWLPSIRKEYSVGIKMSRDISTAMKEIDKKVDYNVLMRYAAPFLGLREQDYPLSGVRGHILYYTYYLLFKVFFRFRFISWILSRMANRKFEQAARERVKIYQRLKIRYPEIRFPNDKCPYDIKFDYNTIFEKQKIKESEKDKSL